jgi:hypothetical protein
MLLLGVEQDTIASDPAGFEFQKFWKGKKKRTFSKKIQKSS